MLYGCMQQIIENHNIKFTLFINVTFDINSK